MISEAVTDALTAAWTQILYYVTFQFLDPFYGWLCILLSLYVVVMLICYFFGTYFPILRVIGGVMLLIATFGLFAYAKGERDARAHDKARAPKPKPPPEPRSGGFFE